MPTFGLTRDRGPEALWDVIDAGLHDDAGDALPWAVLSRLRHLIPCDAVQFGEMDIVRQAPLMMQGINESCGEWIELEPSKPEDPSFGSLMTKFAPDAYLLRSPSPSAVVLWSDFYTDTELRALPFYCEFLRPAAYAMVVPIPSPPGRARTLLFWRERRDFNDSERFALQLLRPHIYEVFVDAERRRGAIPRLSPREMEVLSLAAQGYDNRDIAGVLFISVATVRKHMEHIRERTGVRSRSAAAALILPHLAPPQRLPTEERRALSSPT